jgi:hypothetical protein
VGSVNLVLHWIKLHLRHVGDSFISYVSNVYFASWWRAVFWIQLCLINCELIMLIKCVSVKNNASGYFEDDSPFLNTWQNRNNIKVCLCPVLPYSQNSIPVLEAAQTLRLVLPTTAVFKLRCVWRTNGMIVPGKNRSTRTKTFSDSTSSPPMFPISDRGSNSALSVWRVRLHENSVLTAQGTRCVSTTTIVVWMLRREIFDVNWQKHTKL